MGTREVSTLVVANLAPFVTLRTVNAVATDSTRTTTVSTSTGGVGRIGAFTGGSGATDMEFDGIVFRDADVSAIEHSRAVEYYNGGL